MLVYSTATGEPIYDPKGFAIPPAWEKDDLDHYGCVHSIGFCADADWD